MKFASLLPASTATVICATCNLVLASLAGAAAISFNDGGNHTINTIFAATDSVVIRDSATAVPTTVNVVGGAFIGEFQSASISIFDNSILNLSGGQLDDEFFLFNNSSAEISGGQVGDDITSGDNSTVNITSVTVNDDIEAAGSSVFTVSGGSFTQDAEAFDSATLNIHGGTFQTDAGNLASEGSATINVFGGTFGSGGGAEGGVFAAENSTINFHGGNFAAQPEGLNASDNGEIHLYGFSGQPASINTTENGKIIFHGGPLQNLTAPAGTIGIMLTGSDGSLANITAEDSSIIRIFGHSFKALNGAVNLPFGPISFAGGNLSGVLADGTAFTNVPFTRILGAVGGTRGAIILAAIPEPGALALVAIVLAGFMTGRWRRRQA